MLERMTISGFGPHRDFTAEFNPTGRTIVSGPSEAGKTSLLEAIHFCLWGRSHGGKFQPAVIHEGMGKALVEIELDSGRVIQRSYTVSGTHRRTITLGEETQTFRTEAAFAEALGDLGRDTDALRLVLSPFEWVPLAEEKKGRPFRDLLARLLPEANVGAEVAKLMAEKGYTLEPGEAEQSEKEVMERRRLAGKARDEATGRQQATEERLAILLGSEPTLQNVGLPGMVDSATLDAVEQWTRYDRLTGGLSERSLAEAELARWEARARELGEEPAWDPSFDGAEERLLAAQRALEQATQVYQQAYGQHQAAMVQLQQFQTASPTPGVCPTCQRPGWEAGQQYLAQLVAYQAQVQSAFEATQASFQQATEEVQKATILANQAREARLRRESWQEARRSLGPKPVVPGPAAPGAALEGSGPSDPAVEPPPMPRPPPEVFHQAQSSLRESAALEGAQRAWKANVAAAQASLLSETERVAETTKVYERLSDLLEAVRAAPSIVAARQSLALGDLGPVTFEFGEDPAVRVLIDGRPWWLASRGRQVVADMYLRGALRRVLDKEWLPIVVDNVQDVGGQPLPDLEGPVVLLITNNEKKISVVRD